LGTPSSQMENSMDERDSKQAILRAVRLHCIDCCGGSQQAVKWCTCDGLHSSGCPLWPYRFGKVPKSAEQVLGPELLDPARMPDASTCLEELAG
jgi:hypothetical protein